MSRSDFDAVVQMAVEGVIISSISRIDATSGLSRHLILTPLGIVTRADDIIGSDLTAMPLNRAHVIHQGVVTT